MTTIVEHIASELENAHKTPSLDVRSPYDQHLLARIETHDAQALETALARAYALANDRKKQLSLVQRMAVLQNLLGLLHEHADALTHGAVREGGKPLLDSRIEMGRCIESIQLCIDALRHDAPVPPVMGVNAASESRHVIMQRQPIGVVLAISAFNHPLNLIAHQIGPAIASACPVLVKPAEDTPLSCIHLCRLLHQAGLPKDWCQWLMPASLDLAEGLVKDERVSFLSFIGSAKLGWSLRRQVAAGTRCALEHGGVAPVVVLPDADIEAMIPALVKGGFYHSGQVCVSVQRIFVHESIAADVAQHLASQAAALRVGDPLSEQTDLGPLIRAAEVDRIAAWVQAAIDEGAECLTGGHALPNQSYAPTVLYQPAVHSLVSQRELFAPVVCVYAFSELSEAIEQANALPMAFQAAVYGRDMNALMQVANALQASTVMLNDHTAFRVDWMPFAGLKQSGLGVGGIAYSMREMQNEKMLVLHTTEDEV